MIADRMAEAGISNMGAYMRKMALNGYVLHVDLSDIRELVSLQRRCANNLNQVAVHAHTYGIYPSEIAALQKDYADLWEPLSELLKKLAANDFCVADVSLLLNAFAAWDASVELLLLEFTISLLHNSSITR